MWFWLRKSSGESLAVSMVGVKLGDRLLIVGCSDPMLIAQLAVKTGLTGRACAVDERAAYVDSAAGIAQREGALIETDTAAWTALPYDSESFDVAVVRDVLPHLGETDAAGCIVEVRRLLRPGGRCLVIDGVRRRGIGSRITTESTRGRAEIDPVTLFRAQGFKAARVLAQREGLSFAEAVKSNEN